MKKNSRKKTLKINRKNNIDSIIEIFQRFSRKYNIVTTTLENNIQYQTKERKITQTYTKTLINTNTKKMLEQLQSNGKLILMIIDNSTTKQEQILADEKIREINKLDNVTTKTIKQKDTYNTLESILRGEI